LAVSQAFSRVQALRTVGLTERKLRQWERLGLLAPLQDYTFPDLVALRTLVRLSSKRLPPRRIARILDDIRSRWSEVKNPLSDVQLTAEGRKIRVRIGEITAEAESGQMLLDFADAQANRLVELPPERLNVKSRERKRQEAERWFQKGVELEQYEERLDEAVKSYEIALALDPQLTAAMVNIGTIYFSARHLDKAEKYYRMAVTSNPRYALALFNLGNINDERSNFDEALKYYLAALEVDPRYADAHYNVALLYQGRGEALKAMQHWRAYLQLDHSSPWTDVARRELRKLYQATVVSGQRPTSTSSAP
jgi:tetratricopeptide (TPR) repeat protein